jgi:PKD repeat protein
MRTTTLSAWLTLTLAALGAGCTVSKTSPPPLIGPSELGLSLTLSASRDIMPRDGVSQATISIIARDPQNQPIRNVTLRVDVVSGDGATIITTSGTLSASTITTDSGGQASVVFTAPPETIPGIDQLVPVMIRAMPIGSNFSSSTPRYLSIRLVPPIVPVIPGAPIVSFTFSPTNPSPGMVVLFDASLSKDLDGTIATYTWNWGDGDGATRTVPNEDHDWAVAGTYYVVLTVTDNAGLQSTLAQAITVK